MLKLPKKLTLFVVGSAGTAVDTHRDNLPSTSSAEALHNMSRPKTVRHTLTPPGIRKSSPPSLVRPDSLSTHASGTTDLETPPRRAANIASPDIINTNVKGQSSLKKSIETKGDRYWSLWFRSYSHCDSQLRYSQTSLVAAASQ